MEIDFSTPIKAELVKLSDINKTMFDIYIDPAEKRHLDEESGFKKGDVNFTWKATDF